MKSILLAAKISKSFKDYLRTQYDILTDIEALANENYSNVHGIVTSNKLLLTAEVLSQFPNLHWIARLGSGMEIIDIDYCNQHQIFCFSSPNGISNSVAEHAVGMLLSLQHRIHVSQNEIQLGDWIREPNRGVEIENMTLGIIGYGHTGRAFAHKMKAFVSNILVYDKYKKDFGNEWLQEVDLKTLQQKANIISFHLPLNSETSVFYNKKFIEDTQNPHIIINTSRGKIANTADILEGLQTKKIIGACLDVLEEEANINSILAMPQNMITQLLQHNVILTPHIAGYSHNAIEKMSEELRLQIHSILNQS